MSHKHQLIGAPVSLYTGKLRSYLRWKGIPHVEVLASADVYRDVIIPRTGVRYIPILITAEDEALQDTTVIIDFLEQRYPETSIYPAGPAQRLAALLLEVYGDEWLVIPAMHYRWNHEENRTFALAEFGRTSAPQATSAEQAAIADRLSKPFAGALPGLGVHPETTAAIEESYLGLLTELDHHFSHHPFLLGGRPSIGDLGLFGPLYAHLYRDPYSGRLMKERAPHVSAWVERMHTPHASLSDSHFLPSDGVPETLFPVLRRMFKEQVPVLLETCRHVAEWCATHDALRLPRILGTHEFALGSARGTRNVYPYAQWMWQRPHDWYNRLDGTTRASLQPLVVQIPGAEAALQAPLLRRLTRRNNHIER